MNTTLMTMLQCAVLSMMPVVELRGALPWAIARGLDPWFSYAMCVLFNMVPVPFILLFLNKILAWMETTKRFAGVARWLKDRAQKKSDTYYKYEMLGLFLLVAIPLPGTGAWTGTLGASFLKMGFKSTVLSVCLGVVIAGLLVGTFGTAIFSIF